MEIHYKTSMWVSISFPDEVSREEILNRLENGESHDDIASDYDCEYLDIYQTQEYIPIEENRGNPTVELMDSVPGKMGWTSIWDNSNKTN